MIDTAAPFELLIGSWLPIFTQDLITDGLYKALALACYSGEHRMASMALIAQALGALEGGGSLVEASTSSFVEASTSKVVVLWRSTTQNLVRGRCGRLLVRRRRQPVTASVVADLAAVESGVELHSDA